jgi:Sec-independent protein translocase protein TatA
MGMTELLVIIAVFLILLGPQEFPRTLLLLVRFIRKGKELMGAFKSQLLHIIEEAELSVYEEESRLQAAKREPLMEADWEVLQKKRAHLQKTRKKKASPSSKSPSSPS